jgi:hypothetical protein
MAKPRPETSRLIRYLVEAVPESLESKSNDGYTPLTLAFSLHRVDAAKILIEAGADQTVRDSSGNNIIHLLLVPAYSGFYNQSKAANDEKTVKPMLDLIDKRLIPSLLTERSSRHPGSLTPIANWMRSTNKENTGLLRALLDFAASTDNEHLELLDASGDTPLHYIVKSRNQAFLQTILEYRPDLLYRENSVGRTPYELAEDAYTTECTKDAPEFSGYYSNGPLINHTPITFAPDYKEPETINKESIWRVCSEFMKKHPGNRKLVSLLDANEVAKRLATRNKAVQISQDEEGSDAGSDAGDNDTHWDEVTSWYPQQEGVSTGQFTTGYVNYRY